MSKLSRTKGANWERDVANKLKELWPNACRGLSQTRGGGSEECDVEGTPYHIECKVGKAINLLAALRQAKADSKGERIPVVIAKHDRLEPVVMIQFDEWLRLQSIACAFEKQWVERVLAHG